MDPYVTRIIHNGGNLNGVIDTPSTGYNAPNYSTPAWNELVIYEMHIRTSCRATAPSGTRPGSQSGPVMERTWIVASAQAKLDYLRDLGVNAIELLPLGEFTGDISADIPGIYLCHRGSVRRPRWVS